MLTVTSEGLIGFYRKTQPHPALIGSISVGWFITTWLLASPVSPTLWWVVFLVMLVVSIVAYVKYVRQSHYRANNYAPLKKDKELERTKFTWQTDGKYIVAFFVTYPVLAIAAQLDSWVWGVIPGLVIAAEILLVMAPLGKMLQDYITPPRLFCP